MVIKTTVKYYMKKNMQEWIFETAKPIDYQSVELAKTYQQKLTKPSGSLGRLEVLAERFAGWQSSQHPVLNQMHVGVFAADHGVCQQNISAFPQEVTVQMIANFLDGGAAISVLSKQLGASLTVCHLGTVAHLPKKYKGHLQLINCSIANGTADFSLQEAMTEEQLIRALMSGRELVEHKVSACSKQSPLHLFIGGEMGIGNTSSASAIYAAQLGLTATDVVGPGTGIDRDGLARKQHVIEAALELHSEHLANPYLTLRCIGGFEIAALVGSYIYCAQAGIPVLVDGFICTAAALIAVRLNPSVNDWLLFSHCSAEPAHRFALDVLEANVLLDLGLCLGEGSGAALAVPLLQAALALHNNMATFEQAGVSGG
ncbi:MAG: nicotinate-nucleotide--dimethylbenzimidazole phosphoribosyltransferase [Candidatus Endobugula sp.]